MRDPNVNWVLVLAGLQNFRWTPRSGMGPPECSDICEQVAFARIGEKMTARAFVKLTTAALKVFAARWSLDPHEVALAQALARATWEARRVSTLSHYLARSRQTGGAR